MILIKVKADWEFMYPEKYILMTIKINVNVASNARNIFFLNEESIFGILKRQHHVIMYLTCNKKI